MVSLIVFLLGLAVGSFLNSVIYRMEKGESALQGRSYCPHCRHQLSWQDLIPLLSFLLLQGKCRYCKKSISLQYPLVELATGVLFLVFITFDRLSDLFLSPYFLVISCLLIIIFVYDLRHYLIPDKILYPAIGLAGALELVRIWDFGYWHWARISDLGFSIVPALVFLALVFLSKETWMGMGDVKLALFMGLFLGWPNILVALFSAFLLGAGVGIALILARKKNLKSQVPFGPFLIMGTFLALFFGNAIIDWYLGLLMV